MSDRVFFTELPRFKTSGGEVMRALRSDEEQFFPVEEAYFSCLLPNAVRAWKLHREMSVNAVVPVGDVLFVVVHEGSNGEEYEQYHLGPDFSYGRLHIPAGKWFGFKAGTSGGVVLNLATVLHTEGESEEAPLDRFSFQW